MVYSKNIARMYGMLSECGGLSLGVPEAISLTGSFHRTINGTAEFLS